MAVIKAVSGGASSIGDLVSYLTKDEKTRCDLMTGVNCSADNAVQEMEETKIFYDKRGGRQYKHFIQSFSPDEKLSPRSSHELALELIEKEKLFDGFECLVVTHIDREHLHNHIVVNSVSLADGHKFRYSKRELEGMKSVSDEICLSHGLGVIDRTVLLDRAVETPVSFDYFTHAFLAAADAGEVESWVYYIAERAEEAKRKAEDKNEYIALLNEKDVSVDWLENRKHLVYKTVVGSETKKVRGSTLEKRFHLVFDKDGLTNEFRKNRERRLSESKEEHREEDLLSYQFLYVDGDRSRGERTR